MAKKGYGADATLVAAAYRLGQSNVPGDFSKIFEKQYEGLIAANKAKASMQGEMLETVTDAFGNIVDTQRKKDKDAEDVTKKANEGYPWNDDSSDSKYYEPTAEEKVIGNYTDGQIKKSAANFNGGSGLNPAHTDADENYIKSISEEYKNLSEWKGLKQSTSNQKKKKDLLKQITSFRQIYNKDQAQFSSTATSWDKGLVSKNTSFKNQPELKMLWTQLMQGDANFAEKGIKVYRDASSGKKMIEYTPGRMGVEMKSIVGDSDYDFTLEDSKEKRQISQEELLSYIKPKETKSENDMNTISTQLLGNINKTTTNPINGAKVRTIKDFDEKAGKIERSYYDIAIATDNPNDIYTRELLVGDTPRVYASDLQSNRSIDEAVISQMGIGSDVFTAKELEDGVIDPTELAKHKDAKAKIMEMLTNPKTSFQKEIAAKEYAKYRTDMLRKVFNDERTRIDDAEKIETKEEKARRLQAYEINSIAIQNKFKAAEKEGFTLENLQSLPINKKMHFVKQDGKVYLAYKSSQGKDIKLVYNDPIDLKNKKKVLNILYANSDIRPNEQNIKVTGGTEQANYVNSPEYLNKFIINK